MLGTFKSVRPKKVYFTIDGEDTVSVDASFAYLIAPRDMENVVDQTRRIMGHFGPHVPIICPGIISTYDDPDLLMEALERLGMCDVAILHPGWNTCPSARVEEGFAQVLDIPILEWNQ